MLKHGVFRGEKVLYPDGIGCCIWIPFSDDEDAGQCFDFAHEDIDDLVVMLELMKITGAETFRENDNEQNPETQ